MRLLSDFLMAASAVAVIALVAVLAWLLVSELAPQYMPQLRLVLRAAIVFAAAVVIGAFVYMRRR